MKVGVLVPYAKDDIDFVEKHGFGSIQLLSWPKDPLTANMPDDDWKRACDDVRSRGIEISALGSYQNVLDPKEGKENAAYFERLLQKAALVGVDVVGTFAGRDPEKSVDDNIPLFKKSWSALAKKAEDLGVRVAFENCPMFHVFPFRGVNIAFSPYAWDMMFEAVPSDALGLEYDPSHLICFLIDPVKVIHDYGKKIYHVHAKDAEVVRRNVQRVGIMGPGAVRHRSPGLGEAPWGPIISALVEEGYRGNLDIEGRHDPIFSGELEEQGLLIPKRHLEMYLGGAS